MMKMCEYEFRNGEKCKEKALPNSKYCVLHTDLPKDEKGEEFKRINELKEEKVKEKVNKGDFSFEGANLFKVIFSRMKIGEVNFIDAVVKKDASFKEAKISGSAWFDEAEIGGSARFNEAEIGGDASFKEAKIGGDVSFYGAKKIRGAWFNEAKIGGDVIFSEATIDGAVSFDFDEIKGELSFRDAKFRIPMSQEVACRKAKRICEELGNREEADYYFYREMGAKRKQKHPIIRFLELPFQYIFGYGVYPLRVMATWLSTVFLFAFLFWIGCGVEGADSLPEYIYFSIVTAATPGYGGYRPEPGIYQGLASLEAIVGVFMWAAFIVIFARKYMR